jgi:Ser/Thr protein kinase RdoA (MazF antagonist)
MEKLINVMQQFKIEGNVVSVTPYGNGHINVTYLAVTDKKRYILQKINNSLFTDVDKLMNNIYLVTEHLKKKAPNKTVLTLVKTVDNHPYLTYNGQFYRVYDFIEESVCLQIPRNTNEFYQSAVSFGEFASMLADFDATQLHEILPNFHNTELRFKAFLDALNNNISGRAHMAMPEIEFALARKDMTSKIVSLIESKEMPLKVTHNDTKLNNVLLHEETLEGLAVIDLDTVMPGSICYDFGDSIRFGCNSSYEDEEDLSKVYFKMDMFEAYVKGYLSTMKNITEVEKNHLVDGAIMMTYECGIRFLSDFLNGDTYFKVHKPNHNLFRCRTQFKLVGEMERQRDLMQEIVNKY